jgi:hypothetical protein
MVAVPESCEIAAVGVHRVSLLICLLGCDRVAAPPPHPRQARQELLSLELTELHYNPLGEGSVLGDEYEFVELKNSGPTPLSLTDVAFTKGIDYAFDDGTVIASGQFLVVASNATAFEDRYGFAPSGQYAGKLSNAVDRITLSDLPADAVIASVEYQDRSPWPAEADGDGRSLVPLAADLGDDPTRPVHWRSSFSIHGSPGSEDPPVAYVNEVLAHTDPPLKDSIELFNPNQFELDVGGWFLTDDGAMPLKYEIPPGTMLPARGFGVFDQDAFNADPDSPTSFGLSEHGEDVYLVADTSGCPISYCNEFTYGDMENGVAFGRHVTSLGEVHLVNLQTPTLGAENAPPATGSLIITEVMYSPPPGQDEYLELQNTGTTDLSLSEPSLSEHTWKIDGMSFAFPPSVTLAPGEIVLVVPSATDEEAFRSQYDVPADVRVFAGAADLADFANTLALLKAWKPYDEDDLQILPFIVVETMAFTSTAPWPPEASGTGSALHRRDPSAYANDPVNWEAAPPSPGIER